MKTFLRTVGHGVVLQACTSLMVPASHGRPDRVMRRIKVFSALAGQRFMVSVAKHLAVTAMCGRTPEAVQLVEMNEVTGEHEDIEMNDAPPALRAFARFSMAAGHRDDEQAWAVWLSVPRSERPKIMFALVGVAWGHIQKHMHGHDEDGEDVTEPPVEWFEGDRS